MAQQQLAHPLACAHQIAAQRLARLHVVLVKATDLSLVANRVFMTEDGGGFGTLGADLMIAFLQKERQSERHCLGLRKRLQPTPPVLGLSTSSCLRARRPDTAPRRRLQEPLPIDASRTGAIQQTPSACS